MESGIHTMNIKFMFGVDDDLMFSKGGVFGDNSRTFFLSLHQTFVVGIN